VLFAPASLQRFAVSALSSPFGLANRGRLSHGRFIMLPLHPSGSRQHNNRSMLIRAFALWTNERCNSHPLRGCSFARSRYGQMSGAIRTRFAAAHSRVRAIEISYRLPLRTQASAGIDTIFQHRSFVTRKKSTGAICTRAGKV